MDIKFWIRHIKRKYHEKFVVLKYSHKRSTILKYAQNFQSRIFVETGTFLGDTTDFLKDHFVKLYTIELQVDLYNKAKERFKSYDKIEVIQGDSSKVLSSIIETLNDNVIFWLDGHYSSEFYIGNEFIKTAMGEKNTPIIEELTEILKNGLSNNVILIDDARCFVGMSDYPTIKELSEFLKTKGISRNQIIIKNDIIRITPKTHA